MSADRLTFHEFRRRWPDLPGHARAAAFDSLSQRDQAECWADLTETVAADREHAPPTLSTAISEREPTTMSWPPPPDTRDARADWLRSIPAEAYVERLTGQHVGSSRKLRCPLHDERTPSFHIYAEPGRGWHCYGCDRGGDIFTLASALTGIPARGPDWHVLIDVLMEVFAP